MGSTIKHKGTVIDINNNTIFVELISQSACSACHAKSLCSIDSQKQIIEIKNNNINLFTVGENVNVILKESLGLKAVCLGYFFPFITFVLTLVLCLNIGISEGLSAILSLFILVPYYTILYFFQNKLKKEFYFEIEKDYC